MARLGYPTEGEQPPPPKWNGFFALSQPMEGETLSTYRYALAKVRDGTNKRSPHPVMRREVDRLRRLLQKKRIQLPPSVGASRGGGINAPSGFVLLSYDDYERYPEFYKEDNRLDYEHLNAHGAELFSRRLAGDFLAALKSSGR